MKVVFDEIDHFHTNFDESVPNPTTTTTTTRPHALYRATLVKIITSSGAHAPHHDGRVMETAFLLGRGRGAGDLGGGRGGGWVAAAVVGWGGVGCVCAVRALRLCSRGPDSAARGAPQVQFLDQVDMPVTVQRQVRSFSGCRRHPVVAQMLILMVLLFRKSWRFSRCSTLTR